MWKDELYGIRQYYSALLLTFLEDAEAGTPEVRQEIKTWLEDPEYREIVKEWALFANSHPDKFMDKLNSLLVDPK